MQNHGSRLSDTLPRRTRVRALVAAVVIGLIAPLFAVSAPAQAITVRPRTTYEAWVQNATLKLLNTQRRAHNLPALRMNSRLQLSARRHDATMARANTMSHQVSGESSLARRISATGYNWSYIGENIAWNSQMSLQGVLTLQKLMYNEKAPNDGHRRNILSRSFRDVGVDVYVDRTHHKIWLTTDFGRPL